MKGADWLLGSAERIGLALGLSPFVVGVLIVGIGTSFPEVVSSLFAVFQGVPELVVANALGSNIANILLVVGISAIIAGRLFVTKDLIDLDIPLLTISTVVVLGVVWDKEVVLVEAILLLAMYAVYIWYTVSNPSQTDGSICDVLPSRVERRGHKAHKHIGPTVEAIETPDKISSSDWGFLALGALLLFIGAKYLIDSVIAVSAIWDLAPSVIAILAVAIGTSLPELIVSIKSALGDKTDVALGNIFGSNVFNLLGVIGIPALFGTLPLDNVTFSIGVPALAFVTFIFIVSGISRKVHKWEGAMYVIVYIFFVGKLFGLF